MCQAISQKRKMGKTGLQGIRNQQVAGSNPIAGSNPTNGLQGFHGRGVLVGV